MYSIASASTFDRYIYIQNTGRRFQRSNEAITIDQPRRRVCLEWIIIILNGSSLAGGPETKNK